MKTNNTTPRSFRGLSLLLGLAALGFLAPAAVAETIYQDSFNRDGALGGSTPDLTTGGATWSGGGTTSTANGGQLVFQNEFWLPFVPVTGYIYTLSYELDNPDGPGTNLWGGFSANGSWSDLKGHWLTEIRSGVNGTHASPQGNPNMVIPHGPTYAYTVVLDTQSNPANWTAEMKLDGTSYGTITLGTPAITRVQFMAMGDTGPIVTNFSLTSTGSPPAPADAVTSTVDSSPTTVASDGVTTSTITVTLNDAGSSPVAGKTVTLTSDRGATDTISAASGLSDASGVVTFAVSSTTAGTPVFTATDTTDSVVVTDTATVTFSATGVVSATTSTVEASPTSVAADGSTTSTMTVTLKDGSSNPVAGKAVTLASNRGGADTISAASGLSDASGVVTFAVSSTTAGDATFTATDSTDGVVVTQTTAVTFTAGAAVDANSTVSASPASVPANGASTATITVTLKDANGNPVAGNTATLASDRGATDTISAASGPSNAAGKVTFTVSSLALGDPIFTATDTTDAGVLTDTATVSFIPPPTGTIVTVESFATSSVEGTPDTWQLPTKNPSNTDYVDASQSTWTYVANTSYASASGQSFSPVTLANGLPVSNLNNGVGQASNWDIGASNWGFGLMTIDLGSVVDVTEFNSYSWAYTSRQDQGYTLYYSAASSAPSTGGNLEANGWTSLGSVATTFYTDSGGGHQVGVSFTNTEGTLATARFLLMAVTGGYTDGFFGEVDVVVGDAPPTSNYASWANDPLKGNIPGEPASGDYDKDGLSNLMEYALGKDPRVSSQPAGELIGKVITFTKGTDAVANGDVTYTIETSTTLRDVIATGDGGWTATTTGVTEVVGPPATIAIDLSVLGGSIHFARLKVTQP